MVKDLASSSSSSSGIINSTDNEGNTPLHVAAYRGHLAVVQTLILASPSLMNARNNAGETFLHSVVSGFQTPGFRRLDRQIQLLKHLVSGQVVNVEEIVNAKNNEGKTALHLAITGNIHSDLVELLMTVTCIDVNIRDADGMTPLDILRQRPQSASSELLTRHLMSAGGMLSSQDYSARKVIASHIKRQSMGSSPGTSFRISDVEIFLYTGLENASASDYSPPPQRKSNKLGRLKRLLHWPKTKSIRLSKLVEEVPVPLRQRFSKHKRVRSNQPSPTAKKKLASGVMHGVMQAVPVSHRSRSSSFSKMSFSSQSSSSEIAAIAKASSSCSTQKVNKSLMNQYLCFGGPSLEADVQPYDIYERSVLSAA